MATQSVLERFLGKAVIVFCAGHIYSGGYAELDTPKDWIVLNNARWGLRGKDKPRSEMEWSGVLF